MLQWRCVRERCPAPLAERDAGVTVFLAWSQDPFLLYGAFDLLDDVVVPSPYSDRPYSGDSVEIFLAAAQLNYRFDYHQLVEAPKSASQADFAQIDIGPATVGRLTDYVQDYLERSAALQDQDDDGRIPGLDPYRRTALAGGGPDSTRGVCR